MPGDGERGASNLGRRVEPSLPDEVTGRELDPDVRRQLRTLSKENAEGVARHLVMVSAYLEADDVDRAFAHAEVALRRAGRVAAVREAYGLVVYRRGDFARALAEFRTVRRLSGSDHLLALMVDCERGLGRLERALDLAASATSRVLSSDERVELAIVVSGVRRDLGQADAALVALRVPELNHAPSVDRYRLHYAYAETLLTLDRMSEARQWFMRAIEGDVDGRTDAVERVEELDGIVMVTEADDLDEEDDGVGVDLDPSAEARSDTRR
ncbi:MAG: tetratricopeptide repeat protein [Phycicoccus sp.]